MTGQPCWQEIAEDLNRRIQEGEFGTGTAEGRLPTELQLREHYGASRNTIRDAAPDPVAPQRATGSLTDCAHPRRPRPNRAREEADETRRPHPTI